MNLRQKISKLFSKEFGAKFDLSLAFLLIMIVPLYGWSRSIPSYIAVFVLVVELIRSNIGFFKKLFIKFRNFYFLYFATWFVLLLISVYNSIDPIVSIKAWSKLLLYFMISIIAYDIIKQTKLNIKLIVSFSLYIGLSGIIILILRQLFLYYIEYQGDLSVTGIFRTIRNYTGLFSFSFALWFLFYGLIKNNKQQVIAVFCYFGLFLILILLNQARTPILSMLALTFTLLILNINKFKVKHIIVMLVMMIVLFSLPIIFYSKIAHFISYESSHSYLPTWLIDPHRQAIWQFSFNKLFDLPFFGFGPNTSTLIEGANQVIPWLIDENFKTFVMGSARVFISSSPHNFILELLLDNGFLLTTYFLFGLVIRLTDLLISSKDNFKVAEILLHIGTFSGFLVNFDIYKEIQFVPIYLLTLAIILGLANNQTLNKKFITSPS